MPTSYPPLRLLHLDIEPRVFRGALAGEPVHPDLPGLTDLMAWADAEEHRPVARALPFTQRDWNAGPQDVA